MCGILGFIGKTDSSLFAFALDKIKHRGPDGWGVWENENIKIGHRRLAIIDLSGKAKQPMIFQNRYVLTYNGEIYNYLELKKELEKLGYQFYSQSDAEVLLYAFVQWKENCLLKLNGMWAFAIWDNQEKKLFLAKDRMGKKPLFYIQQNNSFVFASEMKALYPFLKDVSINYELVEKAKKNLFSYEITSDCLIKGIQRFPSGSFGIFENEKLNITKYWKPLENLIQVPSRYETQVEMFRELFLDACKLRMRSDVPIGTALSGGLDSSSVISTVAHIAQKNSASVSHWQNAYTATFPNTSLDESKYAKIAAGHLEIPLKQIEIDPVKEIENIFYYTYMAEELYLTSPIPFFQLYKAIKQDGTSVTIDGHGGDELFGGYEFDLPAALIDALPDIFKFKEYVDTIEDMESSKEKYWSRFYNLLKFSVLNKYKNIIPTHQFNAVLIDKKNGLDYLNSQLYHSAYETVLPTLLRNYDRYSMSNGVEIRMPFLDHRILSFAFSIPYSSKIRNGYSKSIVREAMKDFMPKEIAYRKDKIGFNTPFLEWMKGPLKSWISDLLHSQDFKQSQFINAKTVEQNIFQTINNPIATYEDGESAWKQLMPFIWEKSLTYTKIF